MFSQMTDLSLDLQLEALRLEAAKAYRQNCRPPGLSQLELLLPLGPSGLGAQGVIRNSPQDRYSCNVYLAIGL